MSLKTGIVPYKGWSDTYVGCLVVGICFCALFSSSLLTAFSKQLESYFEDGGTFFSTVFSILSFHGAVLLLIFLFLKSQGWSVKKAFGFNLGSNWTLGLHGVIFGIVCFAVSLILSSIIQWISGLFGYEMESQKAIEILQQTDPSYLKSIVAISFLSVFIAPVAEELLFRGVLYVYLRDIGFRKTAAFICSFIFAMIHCNIAVFLPLFCFSIFLVWLYEKYGNLSVCIVTHSVFNLANVLLCLFWGGEV